MKSHATKLAYKTISSQTVEKNVLEEILKNKSF